MKIDFLQQRADEKLNIYKIFKKLKGETIQEFSVKGNGDQHFHLTTNKTDLKFGANDLGVWVEDCKKIKQD